jgi:acid phosphatase
MDKPQRKLAAAIALCSMVVGQLGVPLSYAAQSAGIQAQAKPEKEPDTESPIKHVVVLLAENRSFDHTFGTYKPKNGQTISNLLSKGIVNADGTPGPNFALAAQFTVAPQPTFYIGAPSKTPYSTLPPPDTLGTPTATRDNAPPFKTLQEAAAEKDLAPEDLALLTTGASGLPARVVDTRVTNAASLPNGPFQLTGPTMPYDAYTGDTIHRFYQMWQQSNCALSNASADNPTGCLSDLYPFVNISFSTNDAGVGNPMAFFNVNDGDAPLLKQLADEFTSSDNFHQSVMGGTAVNHIMLGAGDLYFFSDGNGNAIAPAANLIANPNPRPGTNNNYIADGNWSNCADTAQPGVAPIVNYLDSLPYEAKANCEPGHFYILNNVNPAFLPNGQLRTSGNFVPPTTVRTIGDALNEKDIGWRFYGGGFNAAAAGQAGTPYCQICNPFQYAKSIMGDPAARAEHMKDTADLFNDIENDTLPAVSFAKPDGWLDGHPQSSKLGLFEAYTKNILDKLDANPKLKAKTAIFVAFDETGGYYDSGFIQPIDFFGDGPRIPFIVVSQFSRGGKVNHAYTDHVSILKFIERNWKLAPLTERSRDNLPNPVALQDNPYVPSNMPAIGDLFDMFNFGNGQGN